MTCPNEISNVLLAIVSRGLLYARAAGWSGDSERAALEANHVHNLPNMLVEYTEKKMRYYWQSERPSYMQQVAQLVPKTDFQVDTLNEYQPLWRKLGSLLNEGSGTS